MANVSQHTDQLPAPMLNDYRVALIEDSPDNIDLITTLLREDVGLQHVTYWASGSMFFRWFHHAPSVKLNPHQRQIQLILLDLHIPREDGYQVLHQIRATPMLASSRVVAVTAATGPDTVKRCREVGFDGFIGKPVDFVRFPEQIRHILRGGTVWE